MRFGNYGDLGAKAEEGWGGVKGKTFQGMSSFQTAEERNTQRRFMDELIAIELKDTDDLEEKYPVYYPTTFDSEYASEVKTILLKEIEARNNGEEPYVEWIEENITEDALIDFRRVKPDRAGLKNVIKEDMNDSPKTVRINNLLISDGWAAIHYWEVVTTEDGSKDVNNHMNFYHFVKTDSGLKIDKIWKR